MFTYRNYGCRLFQSSSCLGSAAKLELDSKVDEPLKRQKPQAYTPLKGSKDSISESFWTTSNCDMDISTVQSQGSVSSVSTLTHDTRVAGSSNATSEFINHGELSFLLEVLLIVLALPAFNFTFTT